MGTLLQDVKYGLRMLARNPGFTAVAVLTLALGIGANTAVFTLINAVLLRSLPVQKPGQLVLFYDGVSEGTISGNKVRGLWNEFSHAEYEYFRDHNESFQGLCAFRQGTDRLTVHAAGASEAGPVEQARGHLVSGSYFQVMGVTAALGRTLTAEDDTLAAPPAAVISFNYWRRRFHLDRSVIGRVVDLNGGVFTIVGVAPQEFFGERVETPPDFWLPLAKQPQVMQRESWLDKRDVYWLNLMGRLKPGVSLPQAEATLNTQLRQYFAAQAGSQISAERRRDIQEAHLQLRPGARGISMMRFLYSEPLHVLMGMVGLVLLISCANVATLLLARASARRQEMFVRLAVGAGRVRIVRQLVTESILLALLGAAAGVVLAWWGVKILVAIVRTSPVLQVKPDIIVLSFTVALSLLTGILFGLGPALWATRNELKHASLTSSRNVSGAGSRPLPARALVIAQVALSFLLLIGAALLAHSLVELEHQNLGFKQENLLLVKTDTHLAGYQPAQLLPLCQKIQERLSPVPGIISATLASYSPISGSSATGNFSIQGYTPPPGSDMSVSTDRVGLKFFETLGMPLLLGRTIGPQDTPATPEVAVVNESFVRSFLPNENPIGRHFMMGSPFHAPGAEIIGVVKDARFFRVREKPGPMAYFGLWQQAPGTPAYMGDVIIRTAGDPSGVMAEVRQIISGVDSKLPVLKVTTLRDQVEDSLHQEKMLTRFSGFFALLALVLACVGLYGTMAYTVARRTNEIGIRMALGAERNRILWMVLRETLVLIATGIAIGLPVAHGATRLIKSFLFAVTPNDPVAIVASILLMAAVSALAGYVPARRASRVDPTVALRYE